MTLNDGLSHAFFFSLQNCATWIAVKMDAVLAKHAHATKAGAVSFAIENCAMLDAMSMDNAKMAHAFV